MIWGDAALSARRHSGAKVGARLGKGRGRPRLRACGLGAGARRLGVRRRRSVCQALCARAQGLALLAFGCAKRCRICCLRELRAIRLCSEARTFTLGCSREQSLPRARAAPTLCHCSHGMYRQLKGRNMLDKQTLPDLLQLTGLQVLRLTSTSYMPHANQPGTALAHSNKCSLKSHPYHCYLREIL